jgi:nitrogen-specific signal transduction histidine kinase/ActR/RegA family two-component response regulator
MTFRWCSEFLRTGCVFPPLMLLPGRLFAERAGGTEKTRDLQADLKQFFTGTTDPLLVLDTSLRVSAINAAACRYLATTAEVAMNAPALEIKVLARLLAAASLPERQISSAQAVRTEVSIPDAEGRPIQCRIEVLPLAGGATLVHIEDTTSLLKARRALESSEATHKAVLEARPETTWSMALPEERLLEVSGSVERMFGHQPADFRRRPELWEELVHPADRERVRGEFRRGLASGRPFDIPFTGIHKDRHDLPSLVNRVVPVVDANGWMERCEGSIEDRSQTRRLESQLRGAEMELRNVLESVASGVLVVEDGPAGAHVALCNRRIAQYLGLDTPIAPGTPLDRAPREVRRLLCGSDKPADLARHMTSEDVSDGVVELDNPHRVLHRYAAPLRDTLGAVSGRLLILEDATPAWMLQRRLTHAQKMESMGRLAGGVGHDFNNLMGAVLGFAALLLESTDPSDPRHEPLTHILGATRQAAKLAGALLSFSRESRFERVPVTLNRVVEDSYSLLRSGLDPGIAIDLQLDPALPALLGDELLFQQMIVNLALEAKARLGRSGVLRIVTRTQDGPPPGVTPRADLAQRTVCVEVQGVREHEAGPAPAQVSPEAAGLGLTAVEDIVRSHGGYLEAVHETGRARFTVMFPIAATERTPLLVPEVATAHGHETVLVVDDDAGLRQLAKAGLRQRGYDVVLAESGDRALELLRDDSQHVDLVLLDLAMPGLPGEKVLETLRRTRPDLPVIISSGYSSIESQSAWVAAGASAFVGKPYRIQDLALKMREVLDRVRLAKGA